MQSDHTMEAPFELYDLVAAYQAGLDTEYRKPDYNETEVRVDFVNKLFTLLGWDVDNDKHLSRPMREVVHEDYVYVSENDNKVKKHPDYTFQLHGEKCFYLETKKPSVDILTSASAAFQVRRYGWSGSLPVSILCNFTDLAVYDCSIPPKEGDDPSVARIAVYHFDEYAKRYGDLYSHFSKEAVKSGQFAELFSNVSDSAEKIPFNDYFLRQIKEWRLGLCADMHKNNAGLSEEDVNLLSQRILNRIVFLRICEDRNQEQFGQLRSITTYDDLKSLFVSSDKRYDSGLFNLIDDENIILGNDTIVEIFKNLYYPNSPYEFSVVDSYILGQIYELFLTETVHFNGDELYVIQKPEVIANNGVVTTPKYITDRIVRSTLAPLLEGKTPDEICALKIADICCGSGVFLLSCLDVLESACHSSTQFDDESFQLRRRILANCIYGVDVDPLAVEVAKFSLMIKLLEGVTSAQAEDYLRKYGGEILPNVDSHIVAGNSLVDSDYFDLRPRLLDDVDAVQRIRAFDWDGDFPSQGFDAIVGNPPYVRVQRLVNSAPEEYDYARSGASPYSTGSVTTIDKYFLFVERAMSKIKNSGVLGYIIPHKFMTNESGKALRKLLAKSKRVRRIVHFGSQQIFEGKTTYVCIIEVAGDKTDSFDISFVDDLPSFKYVGTPKPITYAESYLGETPWVFPPQSIRDIVTRNSYRTSRLDDIAAIHVGLQTSDDKVFILAHAEVEGDLVKFVDGVDGSQVTIEKAITRPAIYDLSLTRYFPLDANCRILFPYPNTGAGRKIVPYTESQMESLFPKALAYLKKHKKRLNKRNMPNRNSDNWYGYGRSQSIGWIRSGDRLVWSVLSKQGNYVFDNYAAFTGGGNGPYYGLSMKPNVQESIYYLQALLNHWFLEDIVRFSASGFRGGYYSHGKQFIAGLPIRRINFSNSDERQAHDAIVNCVKQLMKLGAAMRKERVSSRRKPLEKAMESVEMQLNDIVDRLYDISDAEKRRIANEEAR